MSVDIIVLPVHNAANQVLTLYDAITKQIQNLMSITIIDNGSTDGLGPKSVLLSDSVLFTKSSKKINNTSFLVSHSILKNPDPNDYVLLLQPNTQIPENYIQSLVSYIEIEDPDIVFGAVGTAKSRSTQVKPDPRVEKYKKYLKTQATSTFTAASDSHTPTKNSGNRTPNPEIEKKTEKVTEKVNWSGIDLNIAYNKDKKVVQTPHGTLILEKPTKEAMEWAKKAILTKKQDSIEKPRVPEQPRLLEPSKRKPKNGFEKYDVVKNAKESVSPATHTEVPPRTEKSIKKATVSPATRFFSSENWKDGFICNNILIRRRILLNFGVFDKNLTILDALLKFLYISTKIFRIQCDFSDEWMVFTHASKKSKKFNVNKIVNKYDAVYKALLAKTDSETKKLCEKSGRQIIPDSSVQSPLESAAISEFKFKNYVSSEFTSLPNYDPIYATIVISEEEYSLVHSTREQLGSLDNLVMERTETARDIYEYAIEFDEEIVIFINPQSKFEYSYFIDDFKRLYRENAVIVASNDFNFRVSDVNVEKNMSFCCHIDRLQDIVFVKGLNVENDVSEIIVGRGRAEGVLQEVGRPIAKGTGWYGWME